MKPPKWLVIAAGLFFAVGGAVAVLFGDLPAQFSTKAFNRLEPGDCFNLPEAGEEFRRVTIIPCDERHDAEVFGHTAAPILDFDNVAFTKCERVIQGALRGSPRPPGSKIEVLVGVSRNTNLGDTSATCVLHRLTGMDRSYLPTS